MGDYVLGGLKVFKALIFLSLAFAFCWTSYFNLVDFVSEKETMSTRVVYPENGLQLPVITLCNKTAYKNVKRNLKLKDYLDNTIDLNDFFVQMYYATHEEANAFDDFLKVLNFSIELYANLENNTF